MIKHKLNYRFESKRHGVRYKTLLGVQKQPLPSYINLSTRMSPVEDQGQEGSCSGHASAACVEFLEITELKKGGPQVYDPNTFEPVSRNFIYWNERVIDGSTATDAGATTLADACHALKNVGVCRESLWPYGPQTLLAKPSDEAYADAAKHKISEFYALDQGYQLKHCLASGYPFMFGFMVFESFESEQVAETGDMQMPQPGEQIIGGHAVCCVGYDDLNEMFIVRNSWGQGWGLNGYFYMPYSFMDSQYTDDYYTLRLNPTPNP